MNDVTGLSFRKGSKVWHLTLGWVKYNRPLVETPECSYVETRGNGNPLVKVMTNDLFSAKPPKPSRREAADAKFASQLADIERQWISYWVAGWMLNHQYRFNISHPPTQLDRVVDAAERYGFLVSDAVVTQSTEKTSGWSCSVVMDEFGANERRILDAMTSVRTTLYHDSYKLSIQQKEFVLGFLGGVLKFHLGGDNTLESIRPNVPEQYREAFDAGYAAKSSAPAYVVGA